MPVQLRARLLIMKTPVKVALGGAVAALSLVLMFMTALIPFGTFAFPTFAGMLLTVIVIEINFGYAVAVYAATALLSFLLVPDKEAALIYTIFLGFYPIIKGLIERIKSKAFQYVIKFALFNGCMIAEFFIAVKLLSIPEDSYYLFGLNLPIIFLLLGNVFFFIYDICITRLVTIYLLKWRDKLNKNTKL